MLRVIDAVVSPSNDAVHDGYRAEIGRSGAGGWRPGGAAVTPLAGVASAGVERAGHNLAVTRAVAAGLQAGGQSSADRLRDGYAADRLARATQAFKDHQAMVQDQAEQANDLGTIHGLAPLQPYRIAMINPWIEPQQLAAVAGGMAARVAQVSAVDALRSGTDDASGSDPAARARLRGVNAPQ